MKIWGCWVYVINERVTRNKLYNRSNISYSMLYGACKIQKFSLTSKTKLSFNVIPKRVSRWHTNKPLSYLLKDHLFTVYCAYNTHFNSDRTCIQFSPYAYPYMFARTHAILPCYVFGPCSSMRAPLSPDKGWPLFPNSVLHVWPQISTKHPLPFIVGLIQSPESCFITLIQDFTLNLSITNSSFGTDWPGPLVVVTFST